MSIQSSITQPLSLMGLLATQAPIVKKGSQLGTLKKQLPLLQKASDESFEKLMDTDPTRVEDWELAATEETAKATAEEVVETAKQIRQLQPNKETLARETQAREESNIVSSASEAYRENPQAFRFRKATDAARESQTRKQNEILESMRKTNPEAVAAYEAVYGKGGMR